VKLLYHAQEDFSVLDPVDDRSTVGWCFGLNSDVQAGLGHERSECKPGGAQPSGIFGRRIAKRIPRGQ